MDLAKAIRTVPDFPKEGILFYDIMTLVENPAAFRQAVDELAAWGRDKRPEVIVAAEARGFVFGAAMAYAMDLGLVCVRKPGKLPYKTRSVSYELEYGTDTLCIHEDAVSQGQRVLVIDDLLATGGTVGGMIRLVEDFGAEVVGVGFVIELTFLPGRQVLSGYDVKSLVTFDSE